MGISDVIDKALSWLSSATL